MKTPLLACAAVLAVVSATAPALAQNKCLRVGQIYNWTVLNDKTLVVENDFHDKYKLYLLGTCQSLRFKEQLAFRSIGGISISCLTPGDQVIARRDFGGMSNRCSITKIEPYTAEMEKADRAARAAKEGRSGY
jgi:hypothetical protein